MFWMQEYTLVIRDKRDARYVAPYAPDTPRAERYLAVHTPDGDWSIVDRRTGKLVGRDEPSGPRHYVYRADVERAVAALNAPPSTLPLSA